MQQLKALLSSGPYMPHGYCFMWNSGLVGLHVISDSLIALAYLSIPFTLGYFKFGDARLGNEVDQGFQLT